jgi:Ca2+/Na+ antiporter
METNDLDNLSRDESFEELKGKCKSNAKRDFYGGLMFLIVVILYLLFPNWARLDETKSILFLIIWILLCCLSVWAVLYSYLLLRRIDSLDTPDQLLYRFEKKRRYNLLFFIAAWILLLCTDIVIPGFTYEGLIRWIVIGVILLFCFFTNLGWYSKEKEILEELKDLVEKE